MKKFLSIAVLLSAAALSACDFEKNAVQDITGTVPGARIKFFNFSVGAPSVNFYADGTKMTAVTSATGVEATTGVAYGGVGNGSLYSGIVPGAYTFAGKISATVDKDLAVATSPATVADGKFYSYYMSGTYNTTTKTTESFVVEDPLPAINVELALVRFVNAISNSSPMVLYAKNTLTGVETAIGAAVSYKTGGAFASLPTGVYDLSTRLAGSSTNIITRAGVSFIDGRVYTVGARGTIAGTGTAVPALDNTTNR